MTKRKKLMAKMGKTLERRTKREALLRVRVACALCVCGVIVSVATVANCAHSGPLPQQMVVADKKKAAAFKKKTKAKLVKVRRLLRADKPAVVTLLFALCPRRSTPRTRLFSRRPWRRPRRRRRSSPRRSLRRPRHRCRRMARRSAAIMPEQPAPIALQIAKMKAKAKAKKACCKKGA